MPISQEEVEEGRFDLAFPIVPILTDSPDLGFNAQEVQQLLMEIYGRYALLVDVERALEILVRAIGSGRGKSTTGDGMLRFNVDWDFERSDKNAAIQAPV